MERNWSSITPFHTLTTHKLRVTQMRATQTECHIGRCFFFHQDQLTHKQWCFVSQMYISFWMCVLDMSAHKKQEDVCVPCMDQPVGPSHWRIYQSVLGKWPFVSWWHKQLGCKPNPLLLSITTTVTAVHTRISALVAKSLACKSLCEVKANLSKFWSVVQVGKTPTTGCTH